MSFVWACNEMLQDEDSVSYTHWTLSQVRTEDMCVCVCMCVYVLS